RGLSRRRAHEEDSGAECRPEGDDRSALREVGSIVQRARRDPVGGRGVMNAAIIAIGSEMLGPTRVDTNSLKITAALEDFGVEVTRKSVVGDRLRDLVDEIRYCTERSDIVATTGGLGPTEDDL